jgi:hypothetical protein
MSRTGKSPSTRSYWFWSSALACCDSLPSPATLLPALSSRLPSRFVVSACVWVYVCVCPCLTLTPYAVAWCLGCFGFLTPLSDCCYCLPCPCGSVAHSCLCAYLPWCISALVPWYLGSLARWCLGVSVPWFVCAFVPLFLGALASLCIGALVSLCLGFSVPLVLGALVPSCLGASVLLPWILCAFVSLLCL